MSSREIRLQGRVAELFRDQPGLSTAEVSQRLSVPEETVLRQFLGRGVSLIGHISLARVLEQLETLGAGRLVVRNEHAIAEMEFERLAPRKTGDWWTIEEREPPPHRHHAHLKFDRIVRGYFVEREAHDDAPGSTISRSIQFFNRRGKSVFKFFLKKGADDSAYERLKKQTIVTAR